MYKEADINIRWEHLLKELTIRFKKTPDIQSILFLIGVQELGSGKKNFTKEQKQDLIHIGNCKVLSISGYYSLQGLDNDGWPIWEKQNSIPNLNLTEQELFLKWHILEYFENL